MDADGLRLDLGDEQFSSAPITVRSLAEAEAHDRSHLGQACSLTSRLLGVGGYPRPRGET
jgi:hypothetical protein